MWITTGLGLVDGNYRFNPVGGPALSLFENLKKADGIFFEWYGPLDIEACPWKEGE